MISECRVLRQIECLLAHKISLEEFEDWLVRSSWNMQRDSDGKAQDLVWKIELSLAEYSSGHLDSKDLRAELRNLVSESSEKTLWHVMNQESVSVKTRSSTTYPDCSRFQPTLTLDYADTPTAKASA